MTSFNSERSHRQSNCGTMSVLLSTRATAIASRSACSCAPIRSRLARNLEERRNAWVAGMLPRGFLPSPWLSSSPHRPPAVRDWEMEGVELGLLSMQHSKAGLARGGAGAGGHSQAPGEMAGVSRLVPFTNSEGSDVELIVPLR
jgi:hypothetical protein